MSIVMFRARRVLLALACLAGMGLGVGAFRARDAAAQDAPVAATDHTVIIVHVVRNGHPAAGRVTIRDDDGHEASCEVDEAGECELDGIAEGRHVVEATGPDGAASGARAVMIPAGGKVSLIVQLPVPNAD